jgi:hypothetical protein
VSSRMRRLRTLPVEPPPVVRTRLSTFVNSRCCSSSSLSSSWFASAPEAASAYLRTQRLCRAYERVRGAALHRQVATRPGKLHHVLLCFVVFDFTQQASPDGWTGWYGTH